MIHKSAPYKEKGIVLLVSLVLILVVTVLTVAALKSTMFGVKNTALLQIETQAYHLLNAELIAQLDALKLQRDTKPFEFEVRATALTDNLGIDSGGTETLDILTIGTPSDLNQSKIKIIKSPKATLATWKLQDSELGMNSEEIPRIEESLCQQNSSNGQSCYNFVIIVQAELVASGTTIQQISGFGLIDPNSVAN